MTENSTLLIVGAVIALLLLIILIRKTGNKNLHGKRIKEKYDRICKAMTPYSEKTVYVDDGATRLEIEITSAARRKGYYISYLFTYIDEEIEFEDDPEADYSGDDEERKLNFDAIRQKLITLELAERKGKFLITAYTGTDEEAYCWKFKAGMDQRKILQLFLDTEEYNNLEVLEAEEPIDNIKEIVNNALRKGR